MPSHPTGPEAYLRADGINGRVLNYWYWVDKWNHVLQRPSTWNPSGPGRRRCPGGCHRVQAAGRIPEVIGFRGGGPHGLAAGEWTDDTSMALALADSIARVAGTSTTRPALSELVATGEYSVNGRCSTSASRRAGAATFQDRRRPDVGRSARNGPAATARSCGWPRCRSATLTCSRPTGGVGRRRGIEPADPCQPAVPVGLRVHGPRTVRFDPRPRPRKGADADGSHWSPKRIQHCTRGRRGRRGQLPRSSRRRSSARATWSRAWRPPCGPSTTPRTSGRRCCGP